MLTKVYLLSVLLAASVQGQGGYGGGYGHGYGEGSMPKIVNAAVISNQRVSFKEVPSRSHVQRTSVFIDSAVSPIDLIFRSSSTPVNIKQQHNPGKGSMRQTSSEDAPHRILHTVTKPIIQMVREIIRPRRIVQQQIMPVQEEIKTIISRSKGGSQGGSSSAGGADADFGSAGLGDYDQAGADEDFGNQVMGNDFGAVDGSDDDGASQGGSSAGGASLGGSSAGGASQGGSSAGGASQGGSSAGGASRRGGSKGTRGGNRSRSQGGKNQAGAGGYGSQGKSQGGSTTSVQAPFAGLGAEEDGVGSGDGDFGNVDMGNDFGGFGGGGSSAGGMGASKGGKTQGGAVGYGSQYGTVGYGSQVMIQGMNPGMI